MYQFMRTPQQRLKSSIGGCITWIVIVVLLIGGLGFFITRARNGVTVSVGAHPTIIGDSCNGPVFIQAGPANQVTIAGIFPQYSQDSTTNTVEISECSTGLTLTVPSESNLQMDANDAITVLGVSGTMKLSANGSTVTLLQVTLEGQSKVEDNGGAIIFRGTIAQESAPTISDNGGTIDMTLPASASFNLVVTGIVGLILSNFPSLQNPAQGTSGIQASVGNSPSAPKLTLDVNDTSIEIIKGAS